MHAHTLTQTHFLRVCARQFAKYRIYMANQQLTLTIKGEKTEKKNKRLLQSS